MLGTDTQLATYISEVSQWRQMTDDRLRSESGWLTLVGLYWLHEGENTIGAASDIVLPLTGAPAQIGNIMFKDGQATLHISADVPVTVDGESVSTALLRDDTTEGGPSLVNIGSITFFVIRRGDEYGIRVRDTHNPARLAFTGRKWFPVDPHYRVQGTFIPHTPSRTLQITNSVGQTVPIDNPGRVEFVLQGHMLSLEAFSGGENEVWFVFRDGTSGSSTYGAGRFLYAPVSAEQTVLLDFNKAYHPPCAFTPFATCPLPPRENILALDIMAGEHL